MQTLFLASGNPGKLQELRALLAELELDLRDPISQGIQLQIEEHGADYAANAALKARAYAAASRMWTLADDSGLEVDALDGAPGLYSARLVRGSDQQRRARLLELLSAHQSPWSARFKAAVVLSSPQGEIHTAHGSCEGQIIPDERGEGGFGYDSIFLLQDLELSMAELAEEVKNQISHRARAVAAIIPVIQKQMPGS